MKVNNLQARYSAAVGSIQSGIGNSLPKKTPIFNRGTASQLEKEALRDAAAALATLWKLHDHRPSSAR